MWDVRGSSWWTGADTFPPPSPAVSGRVLAVSRVCRQAAPRGPDICSQTGSGAGWSVAEPSRDPLPHLSPGRSERRTPRTRSVITGQAGRGPFIQAHGSVQDQFHQWNFQPFMGLKGF